MGNRRSRSSIASAHLCRSLLAAVAIWATPSLIAQTTSEPTDFHGPAEVLVAPTRFAWCAELSPDESWLAACYGYFQGDIGRLRIWDLKTGTVKWEARESRGIRRVAISPDGSLVVSGNYGGEIRFRDAATGAVKRVFGNGGGSVECVSFSKDGRHLASCGNRRALRIWEVATGQMLKTFEGHTDVAYGVWFSPDDKQLVSFGRDRSVRIWNVEEGGQQRMFPHPGEVHAATFLPDGKRIATACEDGQVRILDVDSGELVTTLAPFSQEQLFASAVAASRDGKLLATGDSTRIRIWNTRDWQPMATLDEPRSFTWGLTFSRDAHTLFTAGSDSSIRAWNVATKTQQQRFTVPQSEQIGAGQLRALAISPDGKLLATAIGGNTVELRDRTTGEVAQSFATRHAVTSVAFAPDSQTLLAAGGGVSQCYVESGAVLSLSDSTDTITAVSCSPDGKLYATGGSDNSVRLWDSKTRKPIVTLDGHTAEVLTVAFSHDGKRLISGAGDFTVRVWDVEKQAAVATLKGHAAAINAVAFAADGKTIGTASNDGTAKLWDTSGYRLRATLAHQDPLLSLAFSPGGQTLATGGERGTIRLWNTARGTQRKQLAEHSGAVTVLAFLPDESGLVSGSNDQSIRLWKATAPAVSALAILPAHPPEALSAVFSPDGKWLITSGADNTVAIRDPAKGTIRLVLRGHTSRITRTAVSPDSKLIASVSGDGTVRVWSIQRGELDAMFNGWREKFAPTRAVAFSPDGSTLATGADDGAIKLWSVADQREIRVLEQQSLPITGLVFADGGSLVVSSTGDWRNNQQPGELRIWEVASGKELAQLRGHNSEIKCLAVDKSGKLLASSATGRDVRLWDLSNNTELRTIRLDSLSGSLIFSPDGQRLAMGHYSGEITLWDVASGTIVERFVGHAKGIPGIAFSPDGKLIATAGNDGKLGLWPVSSDGALSTK